MILWLLVMCWGGGVGGSSMIGLITRRLRGTLPFGLWGEIRRAELEKKVQLKKLKSKGHCRVAVLCDIS